MSGVWVMVAVVGGATIALRALGPAVLGGRRLPPRAMAVIALMAPALLAALIVTQTLDAGGRLELDERALGVLGAGAALALRAPVLVVIVVAAAITAVARAVG
jgi:branched-subunit amino acid transport protein